LKNCNSESDFETFLKHYAASLFMSDCNINVISIEVSKCRRRFVK